MKKISFIGAGNMAYAMASAFYNGENSGTLGFFDINSERVDLFKNSFKGSISFKSVKSLVDSSDIIILSVKPQVIDKVLAELKDNNKIIISIAAGITLQHLSEFMPEAFIARVMPNTPSLVGQMAAGVSFSDSMDSNKKEEVFNFLSHSGMALEVSENQMDAVTGVSGSGPAFVARIIKHFIDAGVEQGLDVQTSRALALNTFLGTAKLIQDKDMDIEELITMVSSPGGTTIAGRGILESSDIENIIKETVNTTVKRSKELGSLC